LSLPRAFAQFVRLTKRGILSRMNQTPDTRHQTPDTRHRIGFIDALKGFAIFCVVQGHSIENFMTGLDFWHNPVWEFIYTFHMPLFFVISGFFFESSLCLNLKTFLYKKSSQLLLPYFIWLVLLMVYSFLRSFFNESLPFDWVRELKGLVFPLNINPWFLRELFISYFIVYVCFRLIKKWCFVFLLSILFVLFMPVNAVQRFLLPFFFVGILLRNNYQYFLDHIKRILFCSIIIFVICLVFWDGNYTVYVSGLKSIVRIRESFRLGAVVLDFDNLPISAFRLVTGISGSILFFALFLIMYRENRFYLCLSTIGKYSMGIYILHIYIIYNFMGKYIDFPNMNIWIYSLVATPFISLFVVILCNVIIQLVHKNRYIELLLFGSSFQRISE
jgi:fucose 4-O-acetylase-like acetyltransferase